MSNLTTTYQNPVAEFQMRVFRFRDETKSTNIEQKQEIKCTLYLEEKESILSTESNDCSCYSEEECSGKIGSYIFKFTTDILTDFGRNVL